METGGSLIAPESVRKLQTALHAKAKGSPDFRFYSLSATGEEGDTGRAYIGTRPSRSSVVSVCRRISELTHRRYGLLDSETVVRRLNRVMTGWANYFQLGQVSPAYKAVDEHAIRRLRQWLCRKHKVRAGKYVRFPDKRLPDDLGLTRLVSRTARFPWANA